MPDKSQKTRQMSFLTKIMLAANGLVLLFYIAGYLAAYIPPDRSWYFAFAGFAFPYIALINAFFVVFWMSAGKRYYLISMAFLLLSWGRLSGFVQVNRKAAPLEVKSVIKVMSYNVRIFDRYNWKKGQISKNAGEIFSLTEKVAPDILCIQEYHNGKSGLAIVSDSIQKYSGLKNIQIEFASMNGTKKPFGIATFSRWPMVAQHVIHFEKNPLNCCIYSDIAFAGDTLRIFNIHLESIRLSSEDYLYVSDLTNKSENQEIISESLFKILRKFKNAYISRASQARQIAELIKNSPYPVIVCGDFNDTPSSYTYHQLSNGLMDAFKESGSGFGHTFAGLIPAFRIDYILHSPELESTGYRRIRQQLSDHFPIVAYIEIPPAKEAKSTAK